MDKKNAHLVYGLVIGLVMAVMNMAFYVTGMSFKPGMQSIQYVSYIPFLAGIILNAMAFSKAKDGYVTFGNVFGSGFKASMVVTLVLIGWSVISMFIFPEMKDKALEMARETMEKSEKKMTDEQLDMALSMTKKFFNVFMIAGILLSTLFYGAIFSLIGAMVAKKKGLAPITSDNF